MFMLISSTRKRPNAVTFGRMFDYQLLDMVELQLVDFKPMSHFKVTYSSLFSRKIFYRKSCFPLVRSHALCSKV